MTNRDLDRLYARVPKEQRGLLQGFRATHPVQQMQIAGVDWEYISCGTGDTALLFLPGAFTRGDMWFHTILALEDTHRIIAPDSFTLQGVYRMDAVCDSLFDLLDAQGIGEAILIGLSAGGGVARAMLQKRPQRVAHLVLSHSGSMEARPGMQKQVSRLQRLVRLLPVSLTRRVLLQRTAGHIPPSSKWIEFHNAYFAEATRDVTKRMILGFLQSSLHWHRDFVFKPEIVQSWPGEMLILASEDDELTMASLAQVQARYPRARTHLFPEGGHHTFILYPEAYTAALGRFIAEVTGPR